MANDYFQHDTFRVPAGSRGISSQVNNIADSIEVGFARLPAQSELRTLSHLYAVDTGVVNAYAITNTYPITSYVEGFRVSFKAGTDNTAGATLNVDALGAKDILRPDGSPLEAGDIQADAVYELVYNGTEFRTSGINASALIIERDERIAADAIEHDERIAADALLMPVDASKDFTGDPIVRTANPNVTLIHTGTTADGQKWDIILLSSDNSLRLRVWNAAQNAIVKQYTFSASGDTSLPGDTTIAKSIPQIFLRDTGSARADVNVTNNSGIVRQSVNFDLAGETLSLYLRDAGGAISKQVTLKNNGNLIVSAGTVPSSSNDLTTKDYVDTNFPAYKHYTHGHQVATSSQTTDQWLKIGEFTISGAYVHKQWTFSLSSRVHNMEVTVEAEMDATNTALSYLRAYARSRNGTLSNADVVAWSNSLGNVEVAVFIPAHSGYVGIVDILQHSSSDSVDDSPVTYAQDSWSAGKPAGSLITSLNTSNVYHGYLGNLRCGLAPTNGYDYTNKDYVDAKGGNFVPGVSGAPVVSAILFDLAAIAGSFEDVGPTGSGMTNTWAALDSVPLTADWIEVKIILTGTTASAPSAGFDEYTIFAAQYLTSPSKNNVAMIAKCATYLPAGAVGGDSTVTIAKIPLSSNNRFRLAESNTFTTSNIGYMYLIGYGSN